MDTVTYSPQDDKLRVYFLSRQSESVLAPLKAAGFRWAGKQECWHAHWTPTREDIAVSTTGAEITDEPSTLESRAEDRADRFSAYSSNASRERDRRQSEASRLAEAMNGQPVLVGHHSEKRHRRDLGRMSDNMLAAHHADKKAGYWATRAKGCVQWASYKERPGVRARRIKKLAAEKRKFERLVEEHRLAIDAARTDAPLVALREFCNVCRCVPFGAWSTLDKASNEPLERQREVVAIVAAEIRDASGKAVANATRWIEHLAGRIDYETAQLAAQGESRLIETRPRDTRRARIPILNIADGAPFRMTAKEYASIHKDYKATEICRTPSGAQYRRRKAIVKGSLGYVLLTDKAQHEGPA